MQLAKPVGAQAAARKYDLITALGSYALAQGKPQQRLVLRLITLLTARYNWVRDELMVGQREIASLWACDERTVKREMAKLRGLGWLVVRRQGARGRVTDYRLDIERMLDTTRERWSAVGPDFARRLVGSDSPAPPEIVPDQAESTNVVSFRGSLWGRARVVLQREDPVMFGAWLNALGEEGRAGGTLSLRAPSRFHAHYVQTHMVERLLDVCRRLEPGLEDIAVLG